MSLHIVLCLFVPFMTMASPPAPMPIPSSIGHNAEALRSGGWSHGDVPRGVDVSHCNIDKIDASEFDEETFRREYVKKGRPLLITGLNGTDTGHLGWTRRKMLENYGTERIHVAAPKITENYHFRTWQNDDVNDGDNLVSSVTLWEFVEEIMRGENASQRYLFDAPVDLGHGESDSTVRWGVKLPESPAIPVKKEDRKFAQSILTELEYTPPLDYFRGKVGAYVVTIGSTGTGMPFHYHREAYMHLFYGSKMWYIVPLLEGVPHGGFNALTTQLDWVQNVLPGVPESRRPRQCLQEGGSLMYVPEGSYHGIVNVGDAVGVGWQGSNTRVGGYTGDCLFADYGDDRHTGPFSKHVHAGAKAGDALAMMHACLDRKPRNHGAMLGVIAQQLMEMGHHEQAIPYMRAEIENNPLSAEPRVKLSQSLLKTRGGADTSAMAEAVAHSLKAFELNPSANAAMHAARMLESSGDISGAADVMVNAVKLAPEKSSEASMMNFNASRLLFMSGRHEEASVQFRRTVRIIPDLVEAWYGLGAALVELKTFDAAEEAEAAMKKGIELTQRLANQVPISARVTLARAIEIQGRAGDARDQYVRALSQPGNNDRGGQSGGEGGGSTDGRSQMAAANDIADAHNGLGRILLNEGKGSAAATEFRSALLTMPNSSEARYNLIIALARSGEVEPAIGELTTYRDRFPGLQQEADALQMYIDMVHERLMQRGRGYS